MIHVTETIRRLRHRSRLLGSHTDEFALGDEQAFTERALHWRIYVAEILRHQNSGGGTNA